MNGERPISLRDAVIEARFAGRHAEDLNLTLQILAEDGFRKPSEVQAFRDAHAEGAKDRATGHPCMCRDCISERSAASEREVARIAYGQRRSAELRRMGVAEDLIERQVETEIAQGAALQARPTLVRKTIGKANQ